MTVVSNMQTVLVLVFVSTLALVGGPAVSSSSGRRTQRPLATRRKRSALPESSQLTHEQTEGAADELFVQRDGTMLSAGTLSSAPTKDMVQRPQPSDKELGAMIALFDE